MNDQVARLLALTPYLLSHPGVTVDETAERFQITGEQLLKDLNVLWFCGRPGLLPDDLIEVDMTDGIITISNAPELAAPLRFTTDEALSLVLALGAVRDVADDKTAAAVDSALAKLANVIGDHSVIAATAELGSGSVEVRTALSQALSSRHRVKMVYHGNQHSSSPTIEVAQFFVRDGYAYVQAWSCDAEEWRIYRLDRVASVVILDDQYSPKEAPELGASWLDTLPFESEVTLTVTPEAEWIAEYYPVRATERTKEGLVVSLGVMSWQWLTSLLLRLGSGVISVNPPEAAQAASDLARTALGYYQLESEL
ncbi:MAG: helix-turn-helix transcriptional regulator [Propionibacteriaceae bacterium]